MELTRFREEIKQLDYELGKRSNKFLREAFPKKSIFYILNPFNYLKPNTHKKGNNEKYFIYASKNPILFSRINLVVSSSMILFPEHKEAINSFWERHLDKDDFGTFIYTLVAWQLIIDLKNYLKLEKGFKKQTKRPLFNNSKDKFISAIECFKREDYPSTINNLNTSIELVLKDKLDIPTTISNIQTNKIIEILVKHKLGPVGYLKEVQKHVFLDNKTKHQGFSPTKIDCVNAIKSVEDLFKRLDKTEIKLTDEIKRKIYGNI